MGRLGDYLHESGYRIAGRVYLFLGFIFLLLPIAFLVLFSFQKNVYSSLPLQGWSLEWYGKLVEDGVLFDALLNSVMVSPVAATAASVIGFLAAYALNRFVFPGRVLTATILFLPILIPPLILGVALLGLLSRLGLHGELYSIILAHTALLTAPAMAIIQLRLAQMSCEVGRYWGEKPARRAPHRRCCDQPRRNAIDGARLCSPTPGFPPRLRYSSPRFDAWRMRFDDRLRNASGHGSLTSSGQPTIHTTR